MIALGFDTATSATAVALRLADGTTLERRDDPAAGAHPGHAIRLLPFAHELLAEAGVDWRAVDRVAVGTGPGRFTGLRVGIATARGLAHSLGAELVGVSSLSALARGAARAYPEQPLLAVIDARRGEDFVAAFPPGSGGAGKVDFEAALRPGELAAAVAHASALAGGERICVAAGDGALRYRAELERSGALVPADDDLAHVIGADAICALGVAASVRAPAEVAPDYRRDADAAIARAPTTTVGRT